MSQTAAPARKRETTWNLRPGQRLAPAMLAWHRLGDGTHCETWLAWSTEHWSPVAVKLPRPAEVGRPRTMHHLRHEAGLLAELAHPAFQRLLADRLDQSPPHLVVEYAEGPTLTSLLEDGPLAPIECLLLGMQLMSALHYLHGRGWVHLDVKPSNLVLREGRLVLLDLGVTARAGTDFPPGATPGSLDYMAPEQLRGATVAVPMDVFATGALLYEAVTGTRAFRGDSDHAADQPQLQGPPPPPSSLVPDIPPALESLLGWLLAPDPADRPASADAALRAMAGLLADGEEGLWPRWATSHLAVAGSHLAVVE